MTERQWTPRPKFQMSFESHYSDGKLCSRTTYNNGILHGLFESWHHNGQLRLRTTHDKGAIHGTFESWYENGQIEIRTTCDKNMWHGRYEFWHNNGKPRTLGTFDKGALQGLYESWYDNGQQRERRTYRDGKLEGASAHWYSNGQMESRVTDWGGSMTTTEEWYMDGDLIKFETRNGDKKHGVCKFRTHSKDEKLVIEYFSDNCSISKAEYKKLATFGKYVAEQARLAESGLGLLVAQYVDLPPS